MSRSDRWPDDYDPEVPKSRSSSRRSSASLSRRNSATKKAPLPATSSANSTPKKVRCQAPEFVVTGRQCLRKSDRANSLPGSHRRPSLESVKSRKADSSRRLTSSSRSHETSLEDEASLDLSQVSDFEDTHSKYGVKQKFRGLATSTPKTDRSKPRSSLQHHGQSHLDSTRSQKSLDFSQDTFTCSRNSVCVSSASTYRYGGASTEVECSSASASSASEEVSPRPRDVPSNWQQWGSGGEWSSFWARYSGRGGCATPFREDIDLADLELSTDGSMKPSPDVDLNCILRTEGLHLTPKETQNMIKCAHILGNVLSTAIERSCRNKDSTRVSEVKTERENVEKRNLTLDLRETNLPADVEEEKRQETVTTQTDISLPNTRSAPRIFEKILRQLSKSSLDEPKTNDAKDVKDDIKKKA